MSECQILNIPNHIKYYVNNQKILIFKHNEEENSVKRIFSTEFPSINFLAKVLEKDNFIEKKIDVKKILAKDCEEIVSVMPICSTVKPNGFFEVEEDGATYAYFNEFLGGNLFNNALDNNIFKNAKNIMTLLKKECPLSFMLLKNLFYDENDEIMLNFLAWLHVVFFKDTRQDVVWLFCGKSEQEQGQGAGKGVLIDFLKEILKGLITQVSNKTYNVNFNSDIMNKKLIFFDEVNFKSLEYEKLKELTGSSTTRIEFKGKEPLIVDNVSNWLLFTNEHDLCGKIPEDDRRTFIIRPNPKNGSLAKIINKNFECFEDFRVKFYAEKDKFLHIVALCNKKVKKSNELLTNAKKDYFREQNELKKEDFKNFDELLVNENLFKRVVEVIEDKMNIEEDTKLKSFCKYKILNKHTFKQIHSLFHVKLKVISEKIDILLFNKIVEKAKKKGFVYKKIERKETNKYKALNIMLLYKSNIRKEDFKNVIDSIRIAKNKSVTLNMESDSSFFPFSSREEFLQAHGF